LENLQSAYICLSCFSVYEIKSSSKDTIDLLGWAFEEHAQMDSKPDAEESDTGGASHAEPMTTPLTGKRKYVVTLTSYNQGSPGKPPDAKPDEKRSMTFQPLPS
jgi:hypothetical protein